MQRMINLVLVVALILSTVPVGVSAQNDVEYTPEWQVSFDDDIVINYCNKDGTIWVTGLANGDVFLTSHNGEEIAHIEALDTGPVLEVVSDGTTEYIGIVYAHSVYLIHVETLTVWHSVTSSSFEYGCACDDNGIWYITATHNSDRQKSLLFAGTYQHNKVGMWASMGTVKPHTLIAHEGGAWVLAESYGSTTRVISVDTTAFPAVSAWVPLSTLLDIDTIYNYLVSPPLPTRYTDIGDHSYIVPAGIRSVSVLVVAGGGAAGRCSSWGAGGGGAGGLIFEESYSVTPGEEIPVRVGAGGSPGADNGAAGGNGNDSIFGNLTAIGGGGGGGGAASALAKSGGSGGGGGYLNDFGAGTPGQGYAGGRSNNQAGAGGGGAGGPGNNAVSQSMGGVGGPGLRIWGDLYAVGGSGVFAAAAEGGSAGGAPGAPNTGNGGSATTGQATTGHGGSGIVIVSFEVALSQATTRTKDFTGSIVDTLTYADSVVIQTDSRLYIQAMNRGGVFSTTTDMGALFGTPHALDATYDLSFVIEGRGPTTDIFRHDGTRVGTYDAGGTVNGVSISRGNGLYALSISQDGKWYLFSKDESSMWYLLYSSPVGTVYNGCALTPYGISFGLWDDITLYVYPTEPGTATTPDGYLSLYITKNSKPYGSVSVNVEQDTGGRVWGEPSLHITDTDGVAVVPVMWGKSLRVTVGANEHAEILTPRPSQLEYIIKVPSDVPLRTGANFRSWYDSALQRIHYSYFDNRGKTHVVEFEVIRNSDNTIVKTETFTIPSGDTSMYTGYYQIPAGFTNTSYRIHLTATGSPSFSNTWHQWISGESGVASLPVELSNTLKRGMFMVLLLFIGGIFSYFSGPHGAVVVSLVAAMLVFWGWLPISPAVIMLCVVWAFLGLLGRTSVG